MVPVVGYSLDSAHLIWESAVRGVEAIDLRRLRAGEELNKV